MVCSNGLPAISEDEDEDVEAAKVAVLCPLLLSVVLVCCVEKTTTFVEETQMWSSSFVPLML